MQRAVYRGPGPVESTTTLGQATEKVCQRTTFHGRSARALNPLAESDAHLLQMICRGLPRLRRVTDTVALHGFRNRDLCQRLLADEMSLDKPQKRQRITRLIRLLRAHSLVQKIPTTHRYQLTPHAPETLTALLAARGADPKNTHRSRRIKCALDANILEVSRTDATPAGAVIAGRRDLFPPL